MPQQFNPYAADEAVIEATVPEYSMPRGTYAAPSLESGDAYNDEFGWGPKLRTSSVETPSAQRLGVIPRYDDYPAPEKPWRFWRRRDKDAAARESVTSGQDIDWREHKGISSRDKRWEYNPRLHPPAETRITEQLSPGTYSFTRPFDQLNRDYDGVKVGSKRHFNGQHFSMADHMRTYEAVGTAPVRTLRNTYRLEPQPWDSDIVDVPQSQTYAPTVVPRNQTLPPRGRSYRLGG